MLDLTDGALIALVLLIVGLLILWKGSTFDPDQCTLCEQPGENTEELAVFPPNMPIAYPRVHNAYYHDNSGLFVPRHSLGGGAVGGATASGDYYQGAIGDDNPQHKQHGPEAQV
jgi:hypothetical protein